MHDPQLYNILTPFDYLRDMDSVADIGTTKLLTDVKAAVLAVDPNAETYLFGSRARGDAKADSDWDIFIATSQTDRKALEEALLDPIYDLMLAHEALIQYIAFSKQRWLRGDAPSPLYDDIREQGIRL